MKVGPIQIFVSDFKKAEKWYSTVLGMKLVKRYPKFKCVLMKLSPVEFDIGTPIPNWGKDWDKLKIGGRTPIFFETDNIKNTVKELKQKGVKFTEEISMRSWGEYKAVFVDPDGNEFSLIEINVGSSYSEMQKGVYTGRAKAVSKDEMLREYAKEKGYKL
ncbi:MAG: VOC family protein [Candidatus Nanoarchaeia archaeon]|nr:VOC family protein [Candidatus Nanoarchaeia archaeon]MDD5239685.1 VOC family protein [Candidatus Nanoarchaeia archaeon]